MKQFRQIQPTDIPDNIFKLIADDWMLVTAGTPEHFNTMTANWGGMGELWFRKVCFCFVRPSRYTYEFMENSDVFTLTFFGKEYRKALSICGSKSGRDTDKMAETGLTPIAGDTEGTTAFDEARIIVECRKIYFQDIDPKNFLSDSIAENYPGLTDLHRMYIGEILSCRIAE